MEAILDLPHVREADRLAAEEVARLLTIIALIDRQLMKVGPIGKRGKAYSLVVIRDKMSRRLAGWLDRLGLTPKGRADWVPKLAAAQSREQLVRILRGGE